MRQVLVYVEDTHIGLDGSETIENVLNVMVWGNEENAAILAGSTPHYNYFFVDMEPV